MADVKKSRRGVYYDLTISPYEYHTPYGEIFKFRSEKKLEIYRRDINSEIAKMTKALNRHGLMEFLPDEIVQMLYKAVYRSFYRSTEG